MRLHISWWTGQLCFGQAWYTQMSWLITQEDDDVFLSDLCLEQEEQQSSEKQFNGGGKKKMWKDFCRSSLAWALQALTSVQTRSLSAETECVPASRILETRLHVALSPFPVAYLFIFFNSTFERFLTMVCWCLPLTGLRAWISDPAEDLSRRSLQL